MARIVSHDLGISGYQMVRVVTIYRYIITFFHLSTRGVESFLSLRKFTKSLRNLHLGVEIFVDLNVLPI